MGHLAVCQRKGCFFPLSGPLFNVAVVLSRTFTYMLTYNIDLGMGQSESGLNQTDKVLQVNS